MANSTVPDETACDYTRPSMYSFILYCIRNIYNMAINYLYIRIYIDFSILKILKRKTNYFEIYTQIVLCSFRVVMLGGIWHTLQEMWNYVYMIGVLTLPAGVRIR